MYSAPDVCMWQDLVLTKGKWIILQKGSGHEYYV